jgi:hypothetical protein
MITLVSKISDFKQIMVIVKKKCIYKINKDVSTSAIRTKTSIVSRRSTHFIWLKYSIAVNSIICIFFWSSLPNKCRAFYWLSKDFLMQRKVRCAGASIFSLVVTSYLSLNSLSSVGDSRTLKVITNDLRYVLAQFYKMQLGWSLQP